MNLKFLIIKNKKIVANKKADNRTIQFANLLTGTASIIQSEIDAIKSQYHSAGLQIPDTVPEYRPGFHELAVLLDHKKLSDEYSFEVFKSLFSKIKKDDFRDCFFWEGLLPFGENYLFSIAIQSKNDKELNRFSEATGYDSEINGLMPIDQRWIYAPPKNSLVSFFGMTEVLEINKGVVGDLKAEKAGYETGRLQEFLERNGWKCR